MGAAVLCMAGLAAFAVLAWVATLVGAVAAAFGLAAAGAEAGATAALAEAATARPAVESAAVSADDHHPEDPP